MIDLHVHSIASDGRDSTEALAEKAIAGGVLTLGLTDHDTVAGLSDMVIHAAAGLSFVPGIELTTDYRDSELHLLGYYIDYHHRGIINACAEIHQGRRQRAQEILTRLKQCGYPLEWEEVGGSEDDFIGRSHILDKLLEKGLVHPWNRDAFFDFYLSKTGKAYVPHYYISPARAVELIWESGGVPVVAHPGRMNGDWEIEELLKMGIAGIEVWYPAHSAAETAKYAALAQKHRLVPTGGTDYHGRGHQSLGMRGVPEGTLDLLRAVQVKGERL